VRVAAPTSNYLTAQGAALKYAEDRMEILSPLLGFNAVEQYDLRVSAKAVALESFRGSSTYTGQ
jgi:hypothetical protein